MNVSFRSFDTSNFSTIKALKSFSLDPAVAAGPG